MGRKFQILDLVPGHLLEEIRTRTTSVQAPYREARQRLDAVLQRPLGGLSSRRGHCTEEAGRRHE